VNESEPAYRIASRTAVVAAVFSLIVSALLLYDYSRRRSDDPLEYAPLRALKVALQEQPDNDRLKEEIRALDLQFRREYFRQRVFAAVGGVLLLAGAAVFLVAAKAAATLHRKLPMPGPYTAPQDVDAHSARIGRWAVAALCVVLLGSAVVLGLALRTGLPRNDQQLLSLLGGGEQEEPPQPADQPYQGPSQEEIARMWPRFRGPGGRGISAYDNIPESWDAAAGKNIRWKTPVPLPGNNSPVVWGDRVFLSGADKQQRQVFCFDVQTGKLLWQKDAPSTPQSSAKPPKVMKSTGYAAPTTTTDGRRVFAVFANGDVAAFEFDGKPAWGRSLGIPKNSYGHASSLTMFDNLVLVQFDQASKKDRKSTFLALSAADGKTIWRVGRDVPNSWTSPIVVRHAGREQLITSADPWVIAYNPADGAELWRAKCMRQDVGPSPTFAGGVVYVANEYPCLAAIRADGQGDVTETHILWEGEDGLPDTCSPLATEKYVFVLASYGTLTCYDAKQGELLWEQDFDAVFTSSPSLVGDRIYLFGEVEEEDEEGNELTTCTTWIVETGREGCKIVGTGELDEGCVTSPAFQDGRIYIRGKKHLFCIAKP